jgi:hypothetical protein
VEGGGFAVLSPGRETTSHSSGGRPRLLRPAGKEPLRTPKSSGEQRETGSPTPSRKDTPALWLAHGKGEGANLDRVRRPELSGVAFHGAPGLIS